MAKTAQAMLVRLGIACLAATSRHVLHAQAQAPLPPCPSECSVCGGTRPSNQDSFRTPLVAADLSIPLQEISER